MMYQLCMTFFSLPLVVQASGAGHWCYASQSSSCGPSHWKDISHNCGGKNQSPINIDKFKVTRNDHLGEIIFKGYDQTPSHRWRLLNDGHSVLLSLEGEVILGHINISGPGLPNTYHALQFHFHWGSPTRNGSEHTVDGKLFPIELHIVHMNAKYNSIVEAKKDPQGLAVLGFLFTVGKIDNPSYNVLVEMIKKVPFEGEHVDLNKTFPLESLLPSHDKLSRYYRYQGSLTTPDCSEAVIWTVFEEPINISQEQLHVLTDTAHFSKTTEGKQIKMTENFRPPQPLGGRTVWASKDATVSLSSAVTASAATLFLGIMATQALQLY